MNPSLSKTKASAKLTFVDAKKITLSLNNNNYELLFTDFPWFENKSQTDLENVEELVTNHFHWPNLSVDLTKDMLLNPKRHPQKSQIQNAQLYDKLNFLPQNIIGEIIEGKLILSPRPANKHISAASYLGALLISHYIFDTPTNEQKWFFADEPEVRFNNHVVVPDIAGWKTKNLPTSIQEEAHFTVAPDWICEVTSWY